MKWNEMTSRLDISGFGGAQVPNEFIKSDKEADVLAILFPGGGYTTAMPLLYYAGELSLQRGWDVLLVNYAYGRREVLSMDELLERLRADAEAAVDAGLRRSDYKAVVLFGKSLGTIAMASVASQITDVEHRLVWLTPLVKRDDVRSAIAANASTSALVIGDADPYCDADIVDELMRAGVRGTVIAGADHSMDIESDIPASIEALGVVFGDIDNFLNGFGQ